jgi:integrase
MPRARTGTVDPYEHRDGRTTTYRVRFRALGQRRCISLGTNHEGWGPERARTELDRILDRVERGTWEPPSTTVDEPRRTETFHVFASRWWTEKRGTLSARGQEDYEWRLGHLLGHFYALQVREITTREVDRYKALKVNAKPKPLSARSINMTLGLLAQILDDAVDYGLLDANPARGKKRRLKSTPAGKTFLEPDMVIDLLDAAGARERALAPHQQYGRRALLATLCLAGPRVTELTDALKSRLDLHGGRVQLGLKTDAGKDRHVELTAFLRGELRAHLALMASLGRPAGARAPIFPTNTGGRHNASNLRTRLLAEAVADANKLRAKHDRPLLPAVTPHTCRRTFASLSLAAGRDPRFVMAQMGHTDARLTLSLYAQVMNRQAQDEALIWSLMRFPHEADTPSSRVPNGPGNDHTAPALPQSSPAAHSSNEEEMHRAN